MKKYFFILLAISFVSTPSFSQNSFTVNSASYLATDSTDEINAMDVAPDGTIYIAGKFPGYAPSGTIVSNLLDGGDGAVLRLSRDGDSIISITRMGTTINDLQISDDGYIAITGTFGNALLNPGGLDFKWVDTNAMKGTVTAHTNSFYGWFNVDSNKVKYKRAMSRIAIGSDNTVASLQQISNYGSSYLYVYDVTGNILFDSVFPASEPRVFPDRTFSAYNINVYPNDVCVDAANQSIIIGGWNPRLDNSRHQLNHPIHMPYLKCFDYAGDLKWVSYDWRAKDVYDTMDYYADSRFNDIAIGRDGYLYTAGYIHGGDHMFTINPLDYTEWSNSHTGYDSYSTPYNMGTGIDHAYFCQYNPVNGQIIKGQAAIVRKNVSGTDKPNQSQIKGIMADENGKLYMSGYCQYYIKNRSLQTINGEAVGTCSNVEPFIMIVNPGWGSRETWTVVSKNGLEGSFWGLGYRNGIVAAAGEVYHGEAITTTNAIQSSRMKSWDGYIMAWGSYSPVTSEPMLSLASSTLNVYPSVTNDLLRIEGENIASIKLRDISGKAIDFTYTDETTLSLGHIMPGMYILTLTTNTNDVRTFKIIKQ